MCSGHAASAAAAAASAPPGAGGASAVTASRQPCRIDFSILVRRAATWFPISNFGFFLILVAFCCCSMLLRGVVSVSSDPCVEPVRHRLPPSPFPVPPHTPSGAACSVGPPKSRGRATAAGGTPRGGPRGGARRRRPRAVWLLVYGACGLACVVAVAVVSCVCSWRVCSWRVQLVCSLCVWGARWGVVAWAVRLVQARCQRRGAGADLAVDAH